MTICGKKEYARFGTSLSVIDLNGDGVLDLAVGEPYSGAETLMYDGGVQVFFGKRAEDQYSLEEGFTLKCEESPCGLGNGMTLSDFGESGVPELLISAPYAGIGGRQRGGVITIRQQSDWESGREYLVPGDIDWDFIGEQDFEQLGVSITAAPGFVAVGSSMFRISAMEDGSFSEDDLQAAGHVKIYKANSSSEIVGTSEFGALGCSLALVEMTVGGESKSLLAVGESSADSVSGGYLQTGSVHLYQVDSQVEAVEEVASFSGNSELGRFGMRLLAGWDGGFLVGAPYTGLGMENYGKVYYFSGKLEIPGDDVTSDCGSAPTPCPGKWAMLELTQHEPESLFGSQMKWEVEGEEVVLVVTAERSSLGSRIGGSLYLYRTDRY